VGCPKTLVNPISVVESALSIIRVDKFKAGNYILKFININSCMPQEHFEAKCCKPSVFRVWMWPATLERAIPFGFIM